MCKSVRLRPRIKTPPILLTYMMPRAPDRERLRLASQTTANTPGTPQPQARANATKTPESPTTHAELMRRLRQRASVASLCRPAGGSKTDWAPSSHPVAAPNPLAERRGPPQTACRRRPRVLQTWSRHGCARSNTRYRTEVWPAQKRIRDSLAFIRSLRPPLNRPPLYLAALVTDW